MKQAFIYEGLRTPRGKGKKDGALYSVKSIDLLKSVMTVMKERYPEAVAHVEDLILGCVTPVAEQGGNIARLAVLHSGWNQETPGVTLNRFCSSGLEAFNQAVSMVQSGNCDLMAAGGVECMSRVPMGSDGGAWLLDPEISNEITFVPQGISADLIATLHQFSREDVDKWAVGSHQKAFQAQQANRFNKSIVSVKDRNGQILLAKDETIRPDTSLEKLASLNASFAEMGEKGGFDAVAIQKYPSIDQIRHVHHAGNSSGIVDGAAVLLVGNEEVGKKYGLKPRAIVHSFASVGSEPTIMLSGPVPAMQKALRKANLNLDQIDLFEINEAFASVVLYCQKMMGMPVEKINVNGGAIAMGHPLGASGAILIQTVLDELEFRNKRYGMATLCVGSGMGTATIIERI